MNKEITSPPKKDITTAQMREILESDHGVVFHPKRKLDIPSIPDSRLKDLVGAGKLEAAKLSLDLIKQYAESEAVSDQWGNRHEERRTWRSEMALEYGDPFLDVYYWNNQLRVNLSSLVRLDINDLGEYTRETGNDNVADRLEEIAVEIRKKMTGEDPDTGEKAGRGYHQMDLDEKLAFVHLLEDRIVEAFNLFSS